MYAYHFFYENGFVGFMVLGSVFLVITGGEALYSDLGHFGRKPIQLAWFVIVLPCLILNYFGQGALLLKVPEAIKNPFFLMAPNWMLTPLVVLATLATVIASQALITGVFSITMQAVQLGYLSRVMIKHTSEKEIGQIYVRSMNRLLMIACIALVVFFKSSSNLAAAYGIAVTMTMAITTILFYFVARELWKWSLFKSLFICGFFLIIDSSFMIANLFKLFDGGFVPLLVGIFIFTFMTTWKRGRKILSNRMAEKVIPLTDFLEKIRNDKPNRVPGTAIYMASALRNTPYSLIHGYEHFQTIHEHLVFLSVVTDNVPRVNDSQRIEVVENGMNTYTIFLHYGYMEIPNIPRELHGVKLGSSGTMLNAHGATYVIGKENLIASEKPGMALWREKLFAFQSINAQDATTYFQLPKNRVMEIGVQVEI
jgi:KUP system potassium uptake protein